MDLVEAFPVLVGMKDQDPQALGSVKAVYQTDPVHPLPSPQLMTSSGYSMGRVTVPVQHDGVRSEVVILVKGSVVQAIGVERRRTDVSRKWQIQFVKGVKTSFRSG